MTRKIFIIICLIIILISCNYIPEADAVVFNIGEPRDTEINDDYDWYNPFTSGAILYEDPDYIENTTKIIDGNLSTGFNDSKMELGVYRIQIYFPNAIFINTITVKPFFEGGSSNYSMELRLPSLESLYELDETSGERTFLINCSVYKIYFYFYPNGSEPFCFNDLLINYSLSGYNSSEVMTAISDMSNTLSSFQSRLDSFKTQMDDMYNLLKNINNTLKIFNFTLQQGILDNITKLQSDYQLQNTTLWKLLNEFNSLNKSTTENITRLLDDYDGLNSSTKENITKLLNDYNKLDSGTKENITNLLNDFNDLNSSIKENITMLLDKQNDLDASTKENITNLWSVSSKLNQSILDIYKKLNELNITDNTNLTLLQQNQKEILENITDLWSTYQLQNSYVSQLADELNDLMDNENDNFTTLFTMNQQLNRSIMNLYQSIVNINLTLQYDLNRLQADVQTLTADITSIQTDLGTLAPDVNKIPELELQLEGLTSRLGKLENNITTLIASLPMEYDDTAVKIQLNELLTQVNSLKDNLEDVQAQLPYIYDDSELRAEIFDLETKNADLKQRLDELTRKLDNMTAELDSAGSERDELRKTLDKQTGVADEESANQGLLNIVFLALIAVLIVVMVIIYSKIRRLKQVGTYPGSDHKTAEPGDANGDPSDEES